MNKRTVYWVVLLCGAALLAGGAATAWKVLSTRARNAAIEKERSEDKEAGSRELARLLTRK